MPVTPSAHTLSTPRSAVPKANVGREANPSSDRLNGYSRLRRPFQTKTNIPSSGPAPRLSTVSIKSVRREHRPRALSVVRDGVLATDMLNIVRNNIQSNQTRSSERSDTMRPMSLDEKESGGIGRRAGSFELGVNERDGSKRRRSSSLLLSSPAERKIAKPNMHLDGFAEEFENDQFGFGLAEHLFRSQPTRRPIRSRDPDVSYIEDPALILDLPSTPTSQASPPEDPLSDPEVIQKIVEGSRKRRPSSGRVKTPIAKRVRQGRRSVIGDKETEAVSKDDMKEEAGKEREDFETDGTRVLKAQGQNNESEGDIVIIPRRKPKLRTVPTRASARLASSHQTVEREKEFVEDLDRTPTRPKPRSRVRPTNQENLSRFFPRTTVERAQSIQSLDSDDLYT